MVMASSGALLASVRHQAGALLLLWAAAAPQLPHSPHSFPSPKLQHQQVWPSLAQTRRGSGDGAQGLEGERKSLGMSPKEGVEWKWKEWRPISQPW